MSRQPHFLVGDVPVYGDVVLAPMAGYADVPHRALCRSFGSALNYTEFIAVEDVIRGSDSAQRLMDFTGDDRPMVVQLFGNDSGKFLEAAMVVEALGPDIIDVNMGCSTRRVSGRGAGVGMMPQPRLIEQTFDLLSRNLSVPVTGKIRLGWDSDINYLDVARIMEDNGASLIALHPRTKEQGYKGDADWNAIRRLRRHVGVPVIGGGDITSPAQIDELLRESGCHAVMIGRGAIGNPWIFSRISKDGVPFEEITRTIRQHLSMMLDYYGYRGLILFRKYLKRYLGGVEGIGDLVRSMLVADEYDGLFELLVKVDERVGTKTQRLVDTIKTAA